MKKGWKTAVAWMLALVLTVGCMTGISTTSMAANISESTYTEMTFSDWGIADGIYSSSAVIKNGQGVISKMAGVAFTGIVNITAPAATGVNSSAMTFGGATANNGIQMFAQKKDDGTENLWFWDNTDVGTKDQHWYIKSTTASEATPSFFGQDMKLRLTFDAEGTSLIMKVYINDVQVGSHTYPNKAELKSSLYLGKGTALAIKSVEPEYVEKTFHDFGIPDRTFEKVQDAQSKEGVCPKDITSFDGVAFSGKVTFPTASQDSYIRIGGKDNAWSEGVSIFYANAGIWFWDLMGTGYHLQIPETEDLKLGDTEITLKVAFQKADTDVCMSIFINGKLMSKRWLAGWGAKFGSRLLVCANAVGAPITIASTGEVVHTEIVNVTAKEATCTEEGRTKGTSCSVCGAVLQESKVIDKKAHTEVENVAAKEATCTEEGCTQGTVCEVCGEVLKESKVIAKKAHKDANGDGKCDTCQKVLVVKITNIAISATTYIYNGKTQAPRIVVKDASGKVVSASNYIVTGTKSAKKAGIYKLTVTMKGSYAGSKTLTWKIAPKKTSITTITPAKRKLTVKWKKLDSHITGYQIQYSLKKNFSGAKTATVKGYKSTSKAVSKLKAKKTYYVRVRTYTKSASGTVYSGWSTAKKNKTK